MYKDNANTPYISRHFDINLFRKIYYQYDKITFFILGIKSEINGSDSVKYSN